MVSINFFLEFIYPTILLVTGIICNLLSFLVFSRKKLKKMALNFLFRLMTITDTITLMGLIAIYNDFFILRFSKFTCRFFIYYGFSLFPIKGMSILNTVIQ